MKFKKLITLTLFIVLSFSITHDLAFALLDTDHCTTSEYVSELDTPSEHGDVCDVHYKFHQASFFPSKTIVLPKIELEHFKLVLFDESYYFNNPHQLNKPPIA